MERAAWTDERLDDLAEGMRNGFARNDQDMRDLRTEIAALRADMREEFRAVNALLYRGGGAIIVAVIAAILTRSL
jgi:hypothetical protein